MKKTFLPFSFLLVLACHTIHAMESATHDAAKCSTADEHADVIDNTLHATQNSPSPSLWNNDDQISLNELWRKALQNHELDCADALAYVGADVNHADSFGNTPLHHAILEGDEVRTQFLLETEDVDPNKSNNDGRTAALLAAMKNFDKEKPNSKLFSLFLKSNRVIDWNKRDKYNKAALKLVLKNQDYTSFTILMEQGATLTPEEEDAFNDIIHEMYEKQKEESTFYRMQQAAEEAMIPVENVVMGAVDRAKKTWDFITGKSDQNVPLKDE